MTSYVTECDDDGHLSTPPDGLYVVRNGIAVAMTAEELAKGLLTPLGEFPVATDLAQALIDHLIRALTRPADGADA